MNETLGCIWHLSIFASSELFQNVFQFKFIGVMLKAKRMNAMGFIIQSIIQRHGLHWNRTKKKNTKSKMLIDYYINRHHMFGHICYG